MKIRYAGINYNDVVDGGKGICLSFWTQGCPYHCKGCHNPETWDFYSGGYVDDYLNIEKKVLNGISNNGIIRNFSILGGEPLCDQNIDYISNLIASVRMNYPDILIFIWTGNVFENLIKNKIFKNNILNKINYLIDGPYIDENRDVTLVLRGSPNQRIIDIRETLKTNQIQTVEKI